jgi:hypothetical protein
MSAGPCLGWAGSMRLGAPKGIEATRETRAETTIERNNIVKDKNKLETC